MTTRDESIAKASAVISRQRNALIGINKELPNNLSLWRDRTVRMLSDFIMRDELRLLSRISTSTYEGDKAAYLKYMDDLEAGIRDVPEHYLTKDSLPSDATVSPPLLPASPRSITRNVFVVHGHDSLAKLDLARTLEKLKLEPIVLHEQPNEGKTIIEKFERDASKVSFAVVMLTPDDIGYPNDKPDQAKSRARQNVILELGFFSGALGRSNVCVLYKGNVEIPTDYLGVVYVNMDDAGAWRFALARELKRAGLSVDMNDLA